MAFLAGVAVQKSLLVVEGSYLDQLVFDPTRYARIAFSLVLALGQFLHNGYSNTARLLLFAVLLVPACWAVLARLRNRSIVCEVFALFNFLILVLWPAAEYGQRFLLPILPLFFLWVAEGLHRLESTSLRRLEKPTAATLTLAVLLSYAGWFSRTDTGPIHEGVSAPEAVALFDWVQKNTNEGDVFLFQKPRAFALYTGRHALAHHSTDDHRHLAQILRIHGATHVVIHHSSTTPLFQKSNRLVETIIAENPSGFKKVFENQGFRIYRICEETPTSTKIANRTPGPEINSDRQESAVP
jgi:hypothetical protein